MAQDDMGELSLKQRKALQALLTCRNVPEAANQAGISQRQMYRYMALTGFRSALSGAEGELLDAATRRLITLQDEAINTLEDTLKDEDTSQTARLRAAQLVLEHCLRLRELRDIEARLLQLEVVYSRQKR